MSEMSDEELATELFAQTQSAANRREDALRPDGLTAALDLIDTYTRIEEVAETLEGRTDDLDARVKYMGSAANARVERAALRSRFHLS